MASNGKDMFIVDRFHKPNTDGFAVDVFGMLVPATTTLEDDELP